MSIRQHRPSLAAGLAGVALAHVSDHRVSHCDSSTWRRLTLSPQLSLAIVENVVPIRVLEIVGETKLRRDVMTDTTFICPGIGATEPYPWRTFLSSAIAQRQLTRDERPEMIFPHLQSVASGTGFEF